MSQVYLAEHRGSTNWGDRKSNQQKSNQIKCWFLVRGENRSTRGKTSRSREENQQTQPTFDVRSGNQTRATLVEGQCSHHCVNTAPVNCWLIGKCIGVPARVKILRPMASPLKSVNVWLIQAHTC